MKLIQPKTRAGYRCSEVLQIIYPRRVLFTAEQMAQAGEILKAIGFEDACRVGRMAVDRFSIKDGRYSAWVRACKKLESIREKETT